MTSKNRTPKLGQPKEYTIREADGRQDAFYLVRQWHHYFGAEYAHDRLPWPLHDVMGWENEDNPLLKSYGVIAEHDDVTIGGGLVSLLDHDEGVDELPDGRFDRDALAGERNAFLWIGVVDPEWRGHGIGRELFRSRLRWATAYGADMIFAYGWERSGGRTSRPLFKAYDFIPVQRFPDYYASEESDRDSCPDCGSWPSNEVRCDCEMTLWALDADDYDR
jgi:GNAT superfamily N-acetyltransferase